MRHALGVFKTEKSCLIVMLKADVDVCAVLIDLPIAQLQYASVAVTRVMEAVV